MTAAAGVPGDGPGPGPNQPGIREEQVRWRPGSRMKGSAVDVLTALRALSPDGRPQVPTIIQAAQAEDSPLHRHFTWDDTIAAVLRREDEARRLVASIVVTYVDNRGREARVPAFISVRREDGRARDYWSAMTLAMDVEQRTRTLWQLKREAAALAKRAAAFEELAHLVVTL